MGKSSIKRTSNTEDQRKNKNKKARNEEEPEDAVSDEENDDAGKGGKKSEKRKAKVRDNKKKKQITASTEESDQSDKSAAESESEDEVLSKTAEQLKDSASKDKEITELQVEKIIAHKQVNNKRKYLVKWKDSSRGETWEGSVMVASKCLDLLRAYNADHEIRDNVEAIISHRRNKLKKVHYLIKWKSNSIDEIWEPAGKMLRICPDLIKTYKAEFQKQNVVESIICHKRVGNQTKYKIKWKDNNKHPTWVNALKLATLCADAPTVIEGYRADRNKRNEIESIKSHKKDKHVFMRYLIKWKDHSRDESWETQTLIQKLCPKMLKDYTEELEKKETNQIKAIIEHKIDHGMSYYLIKWNDKSRDESWETAKKTMSVGPDMLNIFVKMNPDCYPRIPKRSSKYRYPKDSSDIKKKQSKKIPKNKSNESDDDEEWDENEEWEVERILDVWNKKDKSRAFLVHWKGYASKYDSWEPEVGLNCPDLITNFMAKLANAENVIEKELRPLCKPVDRLVDRMTIKPKAKDNNRSSKRHDGKLRAVYFDAEE